MSAQSLHGGTGEFDRGRRGSDATGWRSRWSGPGPVSPRWAGKGRSGWAPSYFTGTPHLFQNIGDGTLFHSGSLAIRQAIAAGTSITYKILYNGAVAMTGGQHADGAIGIPDLTRELVAEGVKRTVVLTDEPERYDGVMLAQGVKVFGREKLDEVQRELREIPGVTALIYDQHCAADLRRKRKRGLAPGAPDARHHQRAHLRGLR
jgi:indolepyruvate ferredoxin oxidoreductase